MFDFLISVVKLTIGVSLPNDLPHWSNCVTLYPIYLHYSITYSIPKLFKSFLYYYDKYTKDVVAGLSII